RVRTRGAGLAVSAASSMAGVIGATVLTVVPLWHRGVSDAEKVRASHGGATALCGLDLGPPLGGQDDATVVPRTVDPWRLRASISSAGPDVRPPGEPRARLPTHRHRPVGRCRVGARRRGHRVPPGRHRPGAAGHAGGPGPYRRGGADRPLGPGGG